MAWGIVRPIPRRPLCCHWRWQRVLIIVDGVDVDTDLITEVQRTSLARPLRRTLLALCKAAGFVAPAYMWER